MIWAPKSGHGKKTAVRFLFWRKVDMISLNQNYTTMSKRTFTQGQIRELLRNPNVERCSEKSISYAKDFKILAVKKYQEGLPPHEIFKQGNFAIDLIGREKPKWCLQRWRKVFRQKGEGELTTETRGRGKGGGRPKVHWTDEKEKLEYLETQVAYLKAKNAFLAKLRKQRLN